MPGYVECFVKCVAMLSYATMSKYVEMEGNGRYERKSSRGMLKLASVSTCQVEI